MVCIECNENLIVIKKRKLCQPCYQKVWGKTKGFGKVKPSTKPNKKEREQEKEKEINENPFLIVLGKYVIITKKEYDMLMILKTKKDRLAKNKRVYFIQDEKGYIKIGQSINPKERLKGLQSSNPLELKLLTTIRSEPGLENAIHNFVKEHRVNGEWFKPDETFFEKMKRFDVILN